MIRDLRLKIRNRHSRISSCDAGDFLILSKQFFTFWQSQTLLRAMTIELLAKYQGSAEEARSARAGVRTFGETGEEQAAICYAKWKAFSDGDNQHSFFEHARGSSFQDRLNTYRDWYVEPFFDYVDEVLEDKNVILSTLIRYKHKVEWYRRSELFTLFSEGDGQAEKRLTRHMYEYLFDQGMTFQAEPLTASGRPDVLALENSDHPFIGEVKIFDASGRGAVYIRKGLHQLYRYCGDVNEPVGYFIVFNVSDKQLQFAMPSDPDGVPRFVYNHKTIFITVIDIHLHEKSASARGIPETASVPIEDVVREIEEQSAEVNTASETGAASG